MTQGEKQILERELATRKVRHVWEKRSSYEQCDDICY